MSASGHSADALSAEQVVQYIKAARELCGSSQLVDIHVHASEVIRANIKYGPPLNGVFSKINSGEYRPPETAGVRLRSDPPMASNAMQNRLSELAFTRAYHYTGPRVLGDQMHLSGVDKAVLLPVAKDSESLAAQMEIIDLCCKEDSRFVAGYSIPHAVDKHAIAEDLERAVAVHGIRMLKLHPNISSIDLSSTSGRLWVEEILRACDNLQIPVLLHGGCSPILGDSPARRFSALDNLVDIDWSLTRAPVVLAHFGVYGCNFHAGHADRKTEQLFCNLLSDNPHIYTDTSGVSYDAIERMLGLVDLDRVVFGSDALYVPMYRQLALLMHALTSSLKDPHQIKTIACDNPARILGP